MEKMPPQQESATDATAVNATKNVEFKNRLAALIHPGAMRPFGRPATSSAKTVEDARDGTEPSEAQRQEVERQREVVEAAERATPVEDGAISPNNEIADVGQDQYHETSAVDSQETAPAAENTQKEPKLASEPHPLEVELAEEQEILPSQESNTAQQHREEQDERTKRKAGSGLGRLLNLGAWKSKPKRPPTSSAKKSAKRNPIKTGDETMREVAVVLQEEATPVADDRLDSLQQEIARVSLETATTTNQEEDHQEDMVIRHNAPIDVEIETSIQEDSAHMNDHHPMNNIEEPENKPSYESLPPVFDSRKQLAHILVMSTKRNLKPKDSAADLTTTETKEEVEEEFGPNDVIVRMTLMGDSVQEGMKKVHTENGAAQEVNGNELNGESSAQPSQPSQSIEPTTEPKMVEPVKEESKPTEEQSDIRTPLSNLEAPNRASPLLTAFDEPTPSQRVPSANTTPVESKPETKLEENGVASDTNNAVKKEDTEIAVIQSTPTGPDAIAPTPTSEAEAEGEDNLGSTSTYPPRGEIKELKVWVMRERQKRFGMKLSRNDTGVNKFGEKRCCVIF